MLDSCEFDTGKLHVLTRKCICRMLHSKFCMSLDSLANFTGKQLNYWYMKNVCIIG